MSEGRLRTGKRLNDPCSASIAGRDFLSGGFEVIDYFVPIISDGATESDTREMRVEFDLAGRNSQPLCDFLLSNQFAGILSGRRRYGLFRFGHERTLLQSDTL